jgi:hypothetical protein
MKKTFQKWFPPLLMAVMALWFFGNLQPAKDKDFAYTEFGRLPLTANGRIVPMDSLARNSLLEIREKQTLNTEPWKDWNEHPKIIPATEWLANVMMNPAVADDWRKTLFVESNPAVAGCLRQGKQTRANRRGGQPHSLRERHGENAAAADALRAVEKRRAARRCAGLAGGTHRV